jgi:hypothetical protein
MPRLLLLLPLVTAACAPKVPPMPGPLSVLGRPPSAVVRKQPTPQVRHDSAGEQRIVEAARHYLRHPTRGFRDDCSGFVMAVLDRAGHPMAGNTASFYAWAQEQGALHRRKRPSPGDLAFFDDTYDRNHNGRNDDGLTHIAVVLEVSSDGTILLAHDGTSGGRTTLRMNLAAPDERLGPDGEVRNDWLRAKRDSDPRGTRYLAGELWTGFATIPED